MNILKYIRKYIISFIFICSVSLPCISSYAVGDSWTSSQSYNYFEGHFDDINTRLNGVIINQQNLIHSFEDFLDEYRDNYNIPSGTPVSDWIGDNISGSYQNGSSGNSDLGISQSLRQAMRDWCNAYIETNTGFYYAYTWNTADFIHFFNDQEQYHAFITFIDSNDSQYHVLFSAMDGAFILLPNDYFNGIVYDRLVSPPGYYDTVLYKNWQNIESTEFSEYKYDSNSKSYILGNTSTYYPSYKKFPLLSEVGMVGPTQQMGLLEVNLNRVTYQVYKNYQAMQNGSEGVQDYYVTDSYNSNISGSYNTTTTDINNTIDYGDVNNYINNYYITNGEYPDPTQINIYINNYTTGDPTPTPTPGPGGDDDDDNNFDWGFLDTIGEFIGHLISALGETLSGILSLLTDVIDLFIGENGLPNIFSQLITYFLGFLPVEFIRLIELFVVCSLILGIIRLIRGH